MEQNTQEKDWREDYKEKRPTLKIEDKEVLTFVFQNNGNKRKHQDFGDSVVFEVIDERDGVERSWYVNASNFDLLNQIKELGDLKDMKVNVSRKGANKSDTRYIIAKSE